jgi:hypothetical protein
MKSNINSTEPTQYIRQNLPPVTAYFCRQHKELTALFKSLRVDVSDDHGACRYQLYNDLLMYSTEV